MTAAAELGPMHALRPEGLQEALRAIGVPAYRGRQILAWVYRRGAVTTAEMTDLPGALREELAERLGPPALEIARVDRSADGTRKLGFRLGDGEVVESVLIPDGKRLTLCVSSQVGCAMGCGFCATARLGLRRHLRVEEIVGQVVLARRTLQDEPMAAADVTNIVFMGMGEPLHNLDSVLPALDALSADWGAGISARRITVSTVGLVPQMTELLERSRAQLAVSLSATTEESRRALMPITKRYSLRELMDACRALPVPRRRRITFEYVMLDDCNDSAADADRLVGLLHGIRAKVNLICFNPFPGVPFQPTPRERVRQFQERLLDRGVSATVRESKGPDIAAACGQLAAEAAARPDRHRD